MLHKKLLYIFALVTMIDYSVGAKNIAKCCCDDPQDSLYVYDLFANNISANCADF